MGYSTYFSGEFTVTPALTLEHAAYLRQFAKVRHVQRDAVECDKLPDPIRDAAELPVGRDGAFYVGGSGYYGQDDDTTITGNGSPVGVPGYWCAWTPNDDGTAIEQDGSEKFYMWDDWLIYLVETFLKPWGYSIDGEVEWAGDEADDRGTIYAKGNRVEAVADSISNAGPSWGLSQEEANP